MRKKIYFLVALFVGAALSWQASDVLALSLPDILSKLPTFTAGDAQAVSLTTDLGFADGGDVNNNGQYEAGDTIKVSFNILNNTDKALVLARLNTKLNANDLNFIHNVQGATSIADENGVISIPNLTLPERIQQIVSFEARINFVTAAFTLSTEPEIIIDHQIITNKAGKVSRPVLVLPTPPAPRSIQSSSQPSATAMPQSQVKLRKAAQ